MAETRIEYGYKLVCATEQPGHEGHDTFYADYLEISPHMFRGDPPEYKYVNGHLRKRVQRTITYSDWTEA